MRGAAARAALLALLLLLALPAGLRAQVPSPLAWRTLQTEHFGVHYTPGLEPLARRAAAFAERAYAQLSRELIAPPRGRIHLLVVDNVDVANGFATPLPRNRVVVYAHPPTDEPSLAFYDDWMELVVTHELVHIFQLDAAADGWRALRSVFGRAPVLFPEFATPPWFIEGLATYYESRLTRAGRVRGSQHAMVLRMAALEGEFFPIDRASGDPLRWPGGSTRYIYGSLFLEHLSRRYGRQKAAEFVQRIANRAVPYTLDDAARLTYGVSFTHAWGEWEREITRQSRALADSLRALGLTRPERLSKAGRVASFPRFDASGQRLAYAASPGREPATTRLLLEDGTERALGLRTAISPPAWMPDGEALLSAELDYRGPYRLLSDAFRIGLDGETERITSGARVWDLDVHPDGRRAVGVAAAKGTNVLAVLDLETRALRRLTAPSPEEAWSLPRFSPEGERIAVVRWREGGWRDLVIVDTAGVVLRELVSDRAVNDAPAWSPDGRYVVFSSDRSGIANLYAYDLERGELRQVTSVLGGAFQPDISRDGRWIAFSDYHADGYHIARIPFDPASWRGPSPLRAEAQAKAEVKVEAETITGAGRAYQAWRTLPPTAWSPVVAVGGEALGVLVGAAVAAEDVAERHRYAAWLGWRPEGARGVGAVEYEYRGLEQPLLGASLRQEWRVSGRVLLSDAGGEVPATLLERERSAAVTAGWRWPGTWSTRSASLGVDWLKRERELSSPELERRFGERIPERPPEVGVVGSAAYSTARAAPYSIARDQGFSVAGSLAARRQTRSAPGVEGVRGYVRGIARTRAYAPLALGGFARHSLAFRLDAGAESGSGSPGLEAGGAGFPVRGYEDGEQRGNRVVSASAEYRAPLLLVERGVRLLPLNLQRIWGDVFADAGAAWCAGRCDHVIFKNQPARPTPLTSAGAEIAADLILGYALPVTLRAGLALPLRPTPLTPREPVLYVRVGM